MKTTSRKAASTIVRDLLHQHLTFEKALKVNQHLFPHLYVLANLLLMIEIASYRGFTFRYLYLDARLMTVIATLSFGLIFLDQLRGRREQPKTVQHVLELNKLVIVPLLLLNYLLVSLDLYYYPNYVYSKFHINPSNVQLLVTFNVLLVVFQVLQRSQSVAEYIWQRLNRQSIVHLAFLLAVISFALPNTQIVSRWMYEGSIKMIRTVHLSWEERFIFLNGGEKSTGWITHYTQFVNRHVPERGVIYIPPQREGWQMEGNPYYLRWFIYPRYTVQSQDIEAPIPAEAEYVLISHGIWPGMTEYGWPRITIPAEKIERIVLLDRETMTERVVTGQAYNPKEMVDAWGVIELKK